MTAEAEKLIETIDGLKGIGKKGLELIKFLGSNRDQPTSFFTELTQNGDLGTKNIKKVLDVFSDHIYGQIDNQDDQELISEAKDILLSQFHKWGISRLVSPRLGVSRSDSHEIYRISMDSSREGLTPELFNVEALKLLNCLCEFYFGDRLLTQFTPAEEHTPVIWEEIKTAWTPSESNTSPESKTLLLTAEQEEEAHYKLWQARLLECDLKR